MLFEDQQGDDGGGDDLKVVEQRDVCRRGAAEADHQEDRRGNIKDDHPECVRQIFFRQLHFLLSVSGFAADKTHECHADSGTKVQHSCHHGRRDILQKEFGNRGVQGIQRSSEDCVENSFVHLGSFLCEPWLFISGTVTFPALMPDGVHDTAAAAVNSRLWQMYNRCVTEHSVRDDYKHPWRCLQ